MWAGAGGCEWVVPVGREEGEEEEEEDCVAARRGSMRIAFMKDYCGQTVLNRPTNGPLEHRRAEEKWSHVKGAAAAPPFAVNYGGMTEAGCTGFGYTL
jgi:hypothetical protein